MRSSPAPTGSPQTGTRRTRSRSEEHTSAHHSHRDLHSFPTRRSSDLIADSAAASLMAAAEVDAILTGADRIAANRDTANKIEIGRAHVCTPLTPRSTLFPYTTLFRSHRRFGSGVADGRGRGGCDPHRRRPDRRKR